MLSVGLNRINLMNCLLYTGAKREFDCRPTKSPSAGSSKLLAALSETVNQREFAFYVLRKQR